MPPKRKWLQPVRSGWEWIKYWNIEASLIAVFIFTFTLLIAIKADNWHDWTGFGNDAVSTTVTTRDANGNVLETQTTTSKVGKTLWDWLNLLGVPFSLVIFSYGLQLIEKQRDEKAVEIQVRAEKLAKEKQAAAIAQAEKERVATIRAEALENYFDRLSSLLVEQNLLALAVKLSTEIQEVQESVLIAEKEKLNASLSVIRGLTLSVLSRFGGDPENKASVIHFLAESGLISKARLDLSRVNLSNTNLVLADLSYAKFYYSNFSHADLTLAILSHADFFFADLKGVNFSYADIEKANFRLAYLQGADFSNTHNVSLASFRNAQYDEFTKFPDGFDPKNHEMYLKEIVAEQSPD